MKTFQFVLHLLIFVSFISCTKSKNQPKVVAVNEVRATYYDYSATHISEAFNDTMTAFFSNENTKDRFVLSVPEGLITETKTSLHIYAHNGELLYEHSFSTSDLVNGYAMAEIKTDAQMQQYLDERMQAFLAEGPSTFKSIAADDYLKRAPVEDFIDYQAFKDLEKGDRVFFYYSLNEESHYYLVYSLKTNQVVKVIDCC